MSNDDSYEDCTVEHHADLWIDGKAPRCRKTKRHLKRLPGQSRLEISDDLRGAAWDALFDFREVKRARIVVTQVYIRRAGGGVRIIIQPHDAPQVQEELI